MGPLISSSIGMGLLGPDGHSPEAVGDFDRIKLVEMDIKAQETSVDCNTNKL